MRQEQLDPLVRRETSVLPDRLVLLVPRGQPVQLALQGTSDRLVLLVQWVLQDHKATQVPRVRRVMSEPRVRPVLPVQ